tara:strand:- start:6370 stop:7014 length:645 start_codon:yes stop_codon:yes gene_type:complete
LERTLGLSKSIIQQESGVLVRQEMNLSIQDTFSEPNIRSVFKGDHGGVGFSVVNILVTRFIDSFAFSNKMSPDQIEMLTVDTLENFSYESLQDIILFFKMARSGKFGNTHRSPDNNLIYGEWFPKYLEQKALIREQNYDKEKNELRAKVVTTEDVKKTYSEIEKKNLHQQRLQYIEKITKDMDRQILEDTIVDWEKDEARKPYVKYLKMKRKTV